MKLIVYCNRIIEYSFYSLFFFVPLVFSGDTSELFEFNKMWLTFGLTIIIGLAWTIKMVVEKKITIQRTPIDILLLLFLFSQIIYTTNKPVKGLEGYYDDAKFRWRPTKYITYSISLYIYFCFEKCRLGLF